jgi:hypothetical protein
LIFVKHIYVDVNTYVITMRLRLMQQDSVGRVGATRVRQNSYNVLHTLSKQK